MSKKISIAVSMAPRSGKSTAKEVALKFGYIYIDAGAMYRAITLKALRNNILLNDSNQLTILGWGFTVIRLEYETVGQDVQLHIIMDNSDVSERRSEVWKYPIMFLW